MLGRPKFADTANRHQFRLIKGGQVTGNSLNWEEELGKSVS